MTAEDLVAVQTLSVTVPASADGRRSLPNL
ncbi:hypothetical protein [Streptomyces torulosus]|nr:hypothetical protein [Streptomyces torulosus]